MSIRPVLEIASGILLARAGSRVLGLGALGFTYTMEQARQILACGAACGYSPAEIQAAASDYYGPGGYDEQLKAQKAVAVAIPPQPSYQEPRYYQPVNCHPLDNRCIQCNYAKQAANIALHDAANADYERATCERNNALNQAAGHSQNVVDCERFYPRIPIPGVPGECASVVDAASFEQTDTFLAMVQAVSEPTWTPAKTATILTPIAPQPAAPTYAAPSYTEPVYVEPISAPAAVPAPAPAATTEPPPPPAATTQPTTTPPTMAETVEAAASDAWQLIGDAGAWFTETPIGASLTEAAGQAKEKAAGVPWWVWLIVGTVAWQTFSNRSKRKR